VLVVALPFCAPVASATSVDFEREQYHLEQCQPGDKIARQKNESVFSGAFSFHSS